jgi:aminopeptidase-like protein
VSYDDPAAGEAIHRLVEMLAPVPRSLTGDGVRETLRVIGEHVPLEVREVATGTRLFDWTAPLEWNLREAWIHGPDGASVVDVRDSPLHVVGYSTPVRMRIGLDELRPHLHSIPDHPDWIPYRTSYYTETWGFCLQHERLERLVEGEYEVCIDATLATGSLTYGECVLTGTSGRDVVVSAHVCHPAMANDNLSGVALATHLAKALADRARRHTYRFVFAPGTIGALAWLDDHRDVLDRIEAGLVLTCVGDRGSPTYKRSRRATSLVDRAVEHTLAHRPSPSSIEPFSPVGYDERQYCSPGFDLPVGCLMRTPWGRFPEYHTSADDTSFVTPEALADSFAVALGTIDVLEGNETLLNLHPYGEPQLGRRGLYSPHGGRREHDRFEEALLWVLNLCDGAHDLLGVAERSGLPFATVRDAADALVATGLLGPVS